MIDADVVTIGAGAVGASVAEALARRGRSVIVVEKEPGPALHQSGRNSGVLHSGYNLLPGSAKATYCVEGNRRLRAYCEERGVPLVVGGILVVARTEAEVGVLREVRRRAVANGVDVRGLDEAGIRAVEPHAAGLEGLQAVGGGSFDARGFVQLLTGDAQRAGATFLYDCRVLAIEDPALAPGGAGGPVVVRTTKGTLRARVVVNAAGLFADRLARRLAPDLRIVPFRGYYAELVPRRRDLVRSHVYSAPDLRFPFLGTHLSRRTDGRVIVGPGAMLAFGREAYRFHDANLRDLSEILGWGGFWRLLRKPGFLRLVRREAVASVSRRAIAREARTLIPAIGPLDLASSYSGIRAQVVDREGRLVDDIVLRETSSAVHVLNAVSPGLTCALPFGEHLAGRVEGKLGR